MPQLAELVKCSCPYTPGARAREREIVQGEWKAFAATKEQHGPRLDAHPESKVIVSNLVEAKTPRFTLFMRLPPEIRRMIYLAHFYQPKRPDDMGKDCEAGEFCRLAVYNGFVPVRQLILVSKAVYQEAMPVFYGTNTFDFMSCRALTKFLRLIGPHQRSYISFVSVVWDVSYGLQASKLLADCPMLKHLEIVIGHPLFVRGSFKYEDIPSLMRRPGTKALLKIRGLTSVDLLLLKRYPAQDADAFEAALQVLRQPHDDSVPQRWSAREVAIHGKGREVFESIIDRPKRLLVQSLEVEGTMDSTVSEPAKANQRPRKR